MKLDAAPNCPGVKHGLLVFTAPLEQFVCTVLMGCANTVATGLPFKNRLFAPRELVKAPSTTLNGNPERRKNVPDTVQPPIALFSKRLLALTGSSQT